MPTLSRSISIFFMLVTTLASSAKADFVFTTCGNWLEPSSKFQCSNGKFYTYGKAKCETMDSRRAPNNTSHPPRIELLFCSKDFALKPDTCSNDELPETIQCLIEFASEKNPKVSDSRNGVEESSLFVNNKNKPKEFSPAAY